MLLTLSLLLATVLGKWAVFEGHLECESILGWAGEEGVAAWLLALAGVWVLVAGLEKRDGTCAAGVTFFFFLSVTGVATRVFAYVWNQTVHEWTGVSEVSECHYGSLAPLFVLFSEACAERSSPAQRLLPFFSLIICAFVAPGHTPLLLSALLLYCCVQPAVFPDLCEPLASRLDPYLGPRFPHGWYVPHPHRAHATQEESMSLLYAHYNV